MLIYRNSNTDPYFNLAAEQYLLDTKQDDIFMLWRNDRAVIVGKNQNTYAELDLDYVEKNNIKVVRRLTGGGAVFHDKGNINFSFIVSGEENATLDFARFTKPIIKALEALGIENVSLSGRNDILIGSSKISGNAQSSYNGKTLHHGTLLYDTDMTLLSGALKVDEEKIRSKGIKSVRNRVNNIKDHLPAPMETEAFMAYLEEDMSKESGAEILEFSPEDKENIQKLAEEKYSSWEWNFGRSMEFSAHKKKRYGFGGVCVDLSAQNGIIKEIKISGDFFGKADVSQLEKCLIGARIEKAYLEEILDGKTVYSCIAGMDKESFIALLLS